jgi:phenylalanyl-tRNA synthetase beta chain
MKVSYNWLQTYLDFPYTAEELSEILTQTGLEVEGLETFEEIQGGLNGVVIGEVQTCEQHPDADGIGHIQQKIDQVGRQPVAYTRQGVLQFRLLRGLNANRRHTRNLMNLNIA